MGVIMKLIKLLLLLSCATQVEAAQLAAAARAARTRAVQIHVMRRAMSNQHSVRPDQARLRNGTIIDLTAYNRLQEDAEKAAKIFAEQQRKEQETRERDLRLRRRQEAQAAELKKIAEEQQREQERIKQEMLRRYEALKAKNLVKEQSDSHSKSQEDAEKAATIFAEQQQKEQSDSHSKSEENEELLRKKFQQWCKNAYDKDYHYTLAFYAGTGILAYGVAQDIKKAYQILTSSHKK